MALFPGWAFAFSIVAAAASASLEVVPSPAPQASATSSVVGAPVGTATVFIPKGTIVVVATLEGLSSYAAHTGEKIQYAVTQDVIVDGYKIAEAGDSAEGQVLESQMGEAENGFGFGFKGGDLRVSVDVVYNFCGDTIAMTFDRTEYRRRQGMFGSNKDVQVIKGQKYGALVSRPQKICGIATAETPAPIPSDVIQTATATPTPSSSPS
jgi:hypothetical protein